NAQTGQEHSTLHGHTDAVTGCAISPGGDWIVSASHDKTLKVWDAHTGQLRMTLQGHTDDVSGCAISPSGDWIVSASGDNTLKVWNARTGTCCAILRVAGGLYTCAFCPDSEHIIAGGDKGVYFLRWVQ